LDLCTKVIDKDGKEGELSESTKKNLLELIEDWASQVSMDPILHL
jgi:hypothetical protein